MGYSRSIHTYNRMKPKLDLILKQRGKFAISANDPATLGYQIRNGIHAAVHNGYEQYGDILKLWVIRATDNELIFDPRPTEIPLEIKDVIVAEYPDAISPLDVVSALIRDKKYPARFPNVFVLDSSVQGFVQMQNLEVNFDNNGMIVRVKRDE